MGVLRVRRWSRLIAVALLFASAHGLPHFEPDDPACPSGPEESYAPHDETQHVLRPGGTADHEHCAVCHWTRSLRSPYGGVAGWALTLSPRAPVYKPSSRAHAALLADNLPARAPPAAL